MARIKNMFFSFILEAHQMFETEYLHPHIRCLFIPSTRVLRFC